MFSAEEVHFERLLRLPLWCFLAADIEQQDAAEVWFVYCYNAHSTKATVMLLQYFFFPIPYLFTMKTNPLGWV